MKRRAFSTIILIFFLIAVFSYLPAFGDETLHCDYAYADFAKQETAVNIEIDCKMETVEKDGKKGVLSSKQSDNLYILCNIKDDFLYDLPIYTPVDITVEYFDHGYGSFSLNYDSHRPQEIFYQGNDIWAASEIVKLSNSNTWKTHTFHIEDMKFTNRCSGGADFRIGVWDPFMGFSDEEVIFGSVKVSRSEFLSLVEIQEVQFEKLGHIYGKDEPITFNQVIVNKTKKFVNVAYTYEYTASQNEIIYQEVREERLQPQEMKVLSISLNNPNFYDLYKLTIKETSHYDDSSNELYTQMREEEFSVSVVLSEEERNPGYGVAQQVAGYSWGDPIDMTTLMKRAGLTFVRDEYRWDQIEKEKGILKLPEDAKEKFVKMHENGAEIIYICLYENPFYDEGRTPSSDEAIAAYARYCAYMAKELKGIVKYFEIWNEYNEPYFNPSNEPPETYVKMLKAAYQAIKQVNPDAIVIGCDTADIDHEWIERVLAAGGGDYMDAISVHPYDWSGSFREFKMVEDTQKLKDIMERYHVEKPIWFTEMGFSTFEGEKGYTQEEQAKNTVLMNAMIKAYDLCDVFTQYAFYDRGNPKEQESCWGFVNYWEDTKNVPSGAKQSYLAVAAMNQLWGNAECKKILADGRFYAIQFYNQKKNCDVMLAMSGAGKTIKNYKLGCQSVDIYDMYGNKIETIVSENGIYCFSIDEIPFYVLGNFESFEETSEKASVQINAAAIECAAKDEAVFCLTKTTDKELWVTIEGQKNVKIKCNDGFLDNQAELVLAVSKDDLDAETFRIIVTDESGIVYYNQKHTLEIKKPVEVTVNSEQAVTNSKTHWRTRVTVVNKSNTVGQSGKVFIVAPEDISKISGYKEFNNLMPGEKIDFLYNLPERVTKQTVDLRVGVELSNGFSDEISTLLDFGTAIYAEKKPVIDGSVSEGEWPGSWIGANEKKDIREIENWGGPSDLSFAGTYMWDENAFYFMAIVTDDIMSVKYSPQEAAYMWKGDNIQFALDDRDAVNIISLDQFTEIGVAKVPGEGDMVYRYKSLYELPEETPVENAEVSIKNYEAYTVYECKIPWSEIFYEGFVPNVEKTYHFSVLANDNDGAGRRGWIEYMSGIGAAKDATLFGNIRFVK